MAENVIVATGKRKTAVARVRMKQGTGKIVVNGKNAPEYFCRMTSILLIEQPLELTSMTGRVDVIARVNGGGLNGQAGAFARHHPARSCSWTHVPATLKRAGLETVTVNHGSQSTVSPAPAEPFILEA